MTTIRPSKIHLARKTWLSPIGICLVLTLFFTLPIHAQWTSVAPNLLGIQEIETGSIVHQSGRTWAGSLKSVYMSPDSGITWINRSPQILGKDYLDAITFFDNKTGIVCTHNGIVYRTDDAGINWREILTTQSAYSAAFLGTADNIIVANKAAGTIHVSRDGGMTWLPPQFPGGSVVDVHPLLGGGAMVLAGSSPKGPLHIFRTNDYGATWAQAAGSVDFDSYSFDVNPCEPNIIYVINEEGTTKSNDIAEIFTSVDAGNSWQVPQSFPIIRNASKFYYSGSIALTTKAVFVQTINNGIERSTDQGTSWKPLGGPSVTFDTRLLCAINSNIIIAADNNGTIWRTITSGGDSLQGTTVFESLSLNPTILFTTDTLVSCDSPVVSTVHMRGIFCKHLKIVGEKIQGINFSDYGISKSIGDSLTGDDSVLISFRPHGSGARNGEYIITLEDSTQLAVPLKGFGKDVLFVEPKTQDIAVDTIGGFAQVPIRFNGFLQKEDLEVVLNYDKRLIYNGSISYSGASLDVAGEAWSGRAKLRIPKNELQLDTISGIAIFTVFPDSTDCYKVALDSMNILSPFAPCTYTIGNAVTATICPPKGCGVMTLTNYMLHGIMPQLRITPNPNQGAAFISSSATLGDGSVEIVDMLGRICTKKSISLTKGIPAKLEFNDLQSGSYYVRVRTQGLQYLIPIAVMH